LIEQCDSLMTYLQQFTDPVKVARVGLIKLDHVYYKHDQIYAKTKEALKGKPDKLKEIYFPTGPTEIAVDTLVASIITHCDKKMKIKAILLQVYHHAIHNRFNEARDLLMKARISQIIAKQQISIQIQYNRAIVQIGLAAFRLGMFEECNSILVDVCQSPKLKESLAQGSSNFSRQQEKTLEEEIEEKKRYIPPHLHANLELVDCVYMTTSMLLEVPNLSQNKFTIQKNVINRNFRKLIEQYDLKGIQFAAQNSRDFIVFASRFLSQSKWEECFDNICQIKIFNKMPEFQAGPLKDALKQKIKEVALKIFFLES
jgi:translation initiation factor 3 subunit C